MALSPFKFKVAATLTLAFLLAGCPEPTVRPTAVLDALEVQQVGFGFTLDASPSTSTDGRALAQYRWTNVDFQGSATPFAPGETVITTSPLLDVAVGGDGTTIMTGVFHFTLVVVEQSGQVSEALAFTVTVRDDTMPFAVLTAPDSVPAGTAIVLDGTASSDPVGAIVEYRWTSLTQSFPGLAAGVEVSTAEPTLTVENSGVPAVVGAAEFQLVVVDESGNVSDPALFMVTITDGI